VALQCLGKHPDALAAFSAGLAEDPKSGQLLAGLVEAASKSPLKGQWLFISVCAFLRGLFLSPKNHFLKFLSEQSPQSL